MHWRYGTTIPASTKTGHHDVSFPRVIRICSSGIDPSSAVEVSARRMNPSTSWIECGVIFHTLTVTAPRVYLLSPTHIPVIDFSFAPEFGLVVRRKTLSKGLGLNYFQLSIGPCLKLRRTACCRPTSSTSDYYTDDSAVDCFPPFEHISALLSVLRAGVEPISDSGHPPKT